MIIIAEIGQAHDGSLGILHSYIDALSKTGVDAIKFQTHIAQAESSKYEEFRINFSYEDKTRYDYWKRMEFTFDQWKEIKQHCEEVGLEFLSSPFSLAAVDLLEKLDVKRYKIGSGEITNLLLLRKVAATGKPIIISSGMSNFKELDLAVNLLKESNASFSILQCTTEYPTSPDTWGLNLITELKNRYKVPIGFSDHSGEIYACLAAATLGAEIFEFHVVFHKDIFGPDTKASIAIDDIPKLARGIHQIMKSTKNPINKDDIEKFSTVKSIFEKSLAINKNCKKGYTIQLNDLETKKPKGYGINASDYKNVIGKTLKRDVNAWDFLNWEDIDE